MAAFVAVVVYTAPHRYGICIGLDVLTRGEQDADSIGYPSEADSTAPSTDEEKHIGQGRPAHQARQDIHGLARQETAEGHE